MERILGNWRISLAALFSVGIILGAYLLARGIHSPSAAEASTETALLQAIASKDADSDGLPDWEEALYGTDSHITDTFKLGMTDGAAVTKGLIVPKAIADIPVATSTPISYDAEGLPPPPKEGTLTAAFTKQFFTLYVAAKQSNGGAALSDSDMVVIADQAIQALTSTIAAAPDFKSAKDMTVSGSGADALKAFAVNVEAVSNHNTANATMNEIQYLTQALKNNDASALDHIASIAKAYRNTAAGISAVVVPQELAAADLSAINAMMRLSEITNDFTKVNADPLAAMLALEQYPPALIALGNALLAMNEVYVAAGVTLAADAPGASFLDLISTVGVHPAQTP